MKLHTLDLDSGLDVIATTIDYAVILTGDCDLEQDFKRRIKIKSMMDKVAAMTDGEEKQEEIRKCDAQKHSVLPYILFGRAYPALLARDDYRFSPEEWENVIDNENERYYFLCESMPVDDSENAGLPPLLMDFKKIFTIPTKEVFQGIQHGTAKRRCFLTAPYLQHLCSRFANNISRVGLRARHADLSSHVSDTKLKTRAENVSGNLLSIEEVEKELGI